RVAAEARRADAAVTLEVPVRERRRGADGHVEGRLFLLAWLDEGVEEDDHVRVPLGMHVAHPEFAASRARTPVDAAQRVAVLVAAKVGELDPLALRPCNLVAGEHLRLQRRDERP